MLRFSTKEKRAAKNSSNLSGRANRKAKYLSQSPAHLCGINASATAQTRRKKPKASSFVPLFYERKAGGLISGKTLSGRPLKAAAALSAVITESL